MRPQPYTHEGVTYPSIRAAARAAGLSHFQLQYKIDPERHKARQKRWHLDNPGKSRKLRRQLAGLPEPTRPEPASCELCDRTPTRSLHLDHDHDTGAFRGWLCSQCNTAVGLLQDCPVLAMRLSVYLGGHR